METIINKGFEKILEVFYKNKFSKIHLRDLARRTKLNENSISRFLKKLEKLKIVTSKMDGNLKKYELMQGDVVYSIFMYFDVQELNSLPSLRKNAIIYFLEKLREKPIIVILFGSTAKKTYKNNSDIDLLLIVNKKIDTKEAEDYSDSQTTININSIQINVEEFKKELKLKEDKVIQSAINTGYPVTNHIEYYRMIHNERI